MENLRKSPHTCQINVIFISITYYYSEIENQKVLSLKEAQFAKEPLGSSLGLKCFFICEFKVCSYMLLQSSHLMPAAVEQPQSLPCPPKLCHRLERATVLQLTCDTGRSYWFRVLSALGRRNINNFRYADNTTLVEESEEELKSPLIKVKEESEKVGLKLNIKNRRSWHPVSSLHGKQGKKMETVTGFIFLGSKIIVDSDCSHGI